MIINYTPENATGGLVHWCSDPSSDSSFCLHQLNLSAVNGSSTSEADKCIGQACDRKAQKMIFNSIPLKILTNCIQTKALIVWRKKLIHMKVSRKGLIFTSFSLNCLTYKQFDWNNTGVNGLPKCQRLMDSCEDLFDAEIKFPIMSSRNASKGCDL